MILLLTFLAAAAAAPLDEKIVGGEECARHSQPWAVSLNEGYHYCGGSLINEQWVVSAAQCYQAAFTHAVILGEHLIWTHEGPEQYAGVDAEIKHPDFDYQTMDNNIMLLKLSIVAEINEFVKPIPLPTACPVGGELCTVSGWGDPFPTQRFSYTLQCKDVTIMTQEKCESAHPGVITDNMLCAENVDGIKDTCNGDSGSSLACDGVLHGIVSWGYGCARPGEPGVYTKVCNYLDWITAIIENV